MKTTIKAAFKVFNTNAKGETSIGLVLKGELNDTQILALHRLKATGIVFADLFDGQADMDDYAHDDVTSEPHEGIKYNVDGSGNVVADTDQITMDEVIADEKTVEVEALKSIDYEGVDYKKGERFFAKTSVAVEMVEFEYVKFAVEMVEFEYDVKFIEESAEIENGHSPAGTEEMPDDLPF